MVELRRKRIQSIAQQILLSRCGANLVETAAFENRAQLSLAPQKTFWQPAVVAFCDDDDATVAPTEPVAHTPLTTVVVAAAVAIPLPLR
jgi:hypothetical protein